MLVLLPCSLSDSSVGVHAGVRPFVVVVLDDVGAGIGIGIGVGVGMFVVVVGIVLALAIICGVFVGGTAGAAAVRPVVVGLLVLLSSSMS